MVTRRRVDPAPSSATAAGTVAVGAIREAEVAGPGHGDFVLPVYNGTDTPADASIASFEDMTATLSVDERIAVAPRSWTLVPFSATPTCDTFLPGAYSSVRLRLRTKAGPSEVVAPVPGEGAALLSYHHLLCDSSRVLTRRELVGVWVLSRVFGEDTGLVGVHLVRFERDGLLTADPEGGLFTDDVGVRGRYRLEHEVLTMSVTGGYGCRTGSSARWRPQEGVEPESMTMVWLSGSCPSGERGDVWIMRRLLHAAPLPPSVRKLRSVLP